MFLGGSVQESRGFELRPLVQNLNGVLTFSALMSPRKSYVGAGDRPVHRLTRHVYVVLTFAISRVGSEPKQRFNLCGPYEAKEEICGCR